MHKVYNTIRFCKDLFDFQMVVFKRRAVLPYSGTYTHKLCNDDHILNHLLDSNHLLRSLTLEDIKLSDCLPQILSLLSDCRLEGKDESSLQKVIGVTGFPRKYGIWFGGVWTWARLVVACTSTKIIDRVHYFSIHINNKEQEIKCEMLTFTFHI